MAGFHTQRGESEALPEQLETITHKIAIDPTRKAQKFPFYDNPHGHLMYFWADRCLLKYIIDLVALGLDSWLVDARGGLI
jgi:hypothetical protein